MELLLFDKAVVFSFLSFTLRKCFLGLSRLLIGLFRFFALGRGLWRARPNPSLADRYSARPTGDRRALYPDARPPDTDSIVFVKCKQLFAFEHESGA